MNLGIVRPMKTTVAAFLVALLPAAAFAQAMHDPQRAIAAQKQAMAALAFMDGVWRGSGWTIVPSGERHTVTQTERVGPFLDGSVKIIEGRGYDANGRVTFNALGVISYDAAAKRYNMRSYAMGHAGDFPVTLKDEGFSWEIPQGPHGKIVYTATVRNNAWHEVGDRIVPGRDPMRFFEMKLERIGATDWPAGSPIPAK